MIRTKLVKKTAVVAMIFFAASGFAEFIHNNSNYPWYVDTHYDQVISVKDCIKDPNVPGRWCQIPQNCDVAIKYRCHKGRISIMDHKGKINVLILKESGYQGCDGVYYDKTFGDSQRVVVHQPEKFDISISSWADDWG